MITKLLASAGIVLGAAVGVAAPALAGHPTPTPTPQPYAGVNNSFSALSRAPSPKCQKGMRSQALSPQQLTQAFQRGIADANRGQQ
jgi:hypothetical protein